MERVDIPITLGFDKTKICGRVKLNERVLQILEKNTMDICLAPAWVKRPNSSSEIIKFVIIPFSEFKKEI